MDGFDWLQSFLPADSQPDPNINNEAYQTHPAFHDAEEVAKAAFMHQQVQRSYSFMRSTNAGTNHALNPQAYSYASGAQYGGNTHQQNSNIQSNNPPSSHSEYPTDRSHNSNHRPNPPAPSQQQHLATQAHQDAYGHGQTRMGPAGPPQSPFSSMPNASAHQSTHRVHETTRPTVPAQGMNQPTARAVRTYENPYQTFSSNPKQNSQVLSQTHMPQRMTTQVQRTHTESPSYSYSTMPPHNPQQPPHSTAAQGTRPRPPVQRTHSAAGPQESQRPYQSHSTTPAQNTQQISWSAAAAAQRQWPGPPVRRTHTPVARPQASQSPYQSHSTTPTQVQRQSHPNAPPSPHSMNTAPLVSETRQSTTPATINREASNPTTQNPATNSDTSNPIPPETSFHNQDHVQSVLPTAPDRVHSPAIPQPAVDNTQSRGYPLPEPLPHQKKRWVPAGEHYSDSMPPAKMRLLGSGKRQTITPPSDPSAGSSVPGAQVPMENARPRGPGRILKNRGDLVQQINPSDALPKKSYDPTTIARDVLIAAGRHPKEKHLNHHLDPLRRNFTRIDYCADLATFRWDLVDAEQPEPQVDRMPPVRRPIPQWQSLPRDPTSTFNHVTTRDHAPVPSRDTPPNRQVALPERIDARAPPGGLSPWGTLPFKPPTYHSPQHILSSNLPSGLPRVEAVPASPKFSSNKSAPLPTPPPPLPQPHPQLEQRRRSTPNSAATPKPPPTTKQVTPKSTTKPKPQGQTVKSQSDSGRIVKFPEARRLPQPQVVIPLSPAKMPMKRRQGRPPKSVASNIEVAIHRQQPVDYQIFPCKWEGCAAQLHNIDSVRAHVIKVHIPHSLVCKWKDCGNKTPMAAADMFQHLATEHISKIAWELGDGPTVPVTAENNPNHPSVLGDRSARKGTMVLPVDEHQVKAFSKAHGKSTEKTKAQALIEAGRHWKQQIGPEMDWSDRRLSTPARQRRVHTGEMAFMGES
ncbi:hypothetical protein PENFLA_c017G03226 [Penicillium flavigenum]|uniref:C2H2-type domain-containing protein n=1 Tax=Penicillium flavigenum TaxID=254877 RepID=A0A1V6T392_9EURO|nr:hypothetical protein PENFLA_c017G03226 [Penicillium flavigenum]